MPAADFSPYLQPSGTGADGTKFDNALNYLQGLLNGLDNNNFAAGKIFDPLKLMQDGAVAGQALVWSAAANGGTGGWVPGTIPAPVTQICDLTLGGAQASFDTNTILGGNIPATYNQLRLLLYLRGDAAAVDNIGCSLRFNNDSGANYDDEDGAAVGGGAITLTETLGGTSASLGIIPAATATANYFDCLVIEIPNYANTTGQKQFLSQHLVRLSSAGGKLALHYTGAAWKSTAAVNRIQILPASGNFIAGSRFTLYGLT